MHCELYTHTLARPTELVQQCDDAVLSTGVDPIVSSVSYLGDTSNTRVQVQLSPSEQIEVVYFISSGSTHDAICTRIGALGNA